MQYVVQVVADSVFENRSLYQDCTRGCDKELVAVTYLWYMNLSGSCISPKCTCTCTYFFDITLAHLIYIEMYLIHVHM